MIVQCLDYALFPDRETSVYIDYCIFLMYLPRSPIQRIDSAKLQQIHRRPHPLSPSSFVLLAKDLYNSYAQLLHVCILWSIQAYSHPHT